MQPLASLLTCRARPHAMLCRVLTSLTSAQSTYLCCFSSPLHPPFVCLSEYERPLLGPCHLVSIYVTLGTSSCLLNFCA